MHVLLTGKSHAAPCMRCCSRQTSPLQCMIQPMPPASVVASAPNCCTLSASNCGVPHHAACLPLACVGLCSPRASQTAPTARRRPASCPTAQRWRQRTCRSCRTAQHNSRQRRTTLAPYAALCRTTLW
jgi:hypothetical protein